jgi:ATP-dependent DNA helicase 2 subunit 2
LSNLDISELLARPKIISKDNAIAEFKQMLDNADGSDNVGLINNAVKQMGEIIRELIQEPVEGIAQQLFWDRAIENVRVMREEMIEYEEPEPYNKFIRALKKDLLDGELGEGSKRVWVKIRLAKLGLIDSGKAEKSEVSAEEADEFLISTETSLPTRNK